MKKRIQISFDVSNAARKTDFILHIYLSFVRTSQYNRLTQFVCIAASGMRKHVRSEKRGECLGSNLSILTNETSLFGKIEFVGKWVDGRKNGTHFTYANATKWICLSTLRNFHLIGCMINVGKTAVPFVRPSDRLIWKCFHGNCAIKLKNIVVACVQWPPIITRTSFFGKCSATFFARIRNLHFDRNAINNIFCHQKRTKPQQRKLCNR